MEEKKATREIDLLALVKQVLTEWKLLLRFAGIAMIIGVIVAICTPKSFKAEVILAPEMSSGGLGLTDNLAEMAANFGIELGGKSSMDAIYPELYPDIFSSTAFVMQLFDVPVRLKEDNTPRTYREHLEKDEIIPFWNYPKIWISELLKPKDPMTGGKGVKDHYKISKKDADLCDAIRSAILCTIDKKTSVISISVIDQDPLAAAILADTLQQRLQTYITNYRTSKARTDYKYYQQLTSAAKNDYEKTRRLYASFADASTNVSLRSVELRLEDLENDMQLKFNTYTSLSNQLEAAKARVQENTPAFTIIEAPIMPYRAASIPRALIVMIFILIGVICDALWVLYGRKWYAREKDGNSK